jgi:hypothetical protein
MSSMQDASPKLRQRSDPPRGHAERLPPQWQNDIGSLAGKVVLITGSTRGIGRARFCGTERIRHGARARQGTGRGGCG